jgi:hypothetical protein
MHIPRRILEHPVEALIAGALLLGLLFGSAESQVPQTRAQMASSQKM